MTWTAHKIDVFLYPGKSHAQNGRIDSTPRLLTLTSRPSTLCVKLEPRPAWWVSALKRPKRLRPMICRNLPRSKAALVVINPYKKLLLSCSSDPTTNFEIAHHEVSRIVSQSDCFDQKARTKNRIIAWKAPILKNESVLFFLHGQNLQNIPIFFFFI